MSKHRNAGLALFQTVPMFSQRCQRFRFERRIQVLNYLDDRNTHGKQLRKRSRRKNFRDKPYKYSVGEEDED